MAFDTFLLDAAPGLHGPWMSSLLVYITTSGNIAVLVTLIACGMFLMFRAGRRRAAWALLLAGLSAVVIDCSLKFAIGRARPDVPWRLIDVPPYPSFPSGHAMGGLAVYATLGWVLRGPAGLALGASWGTLIGLSRVLVGVHYPTDVLAGLILGVAITASAVRLAGGEKQEEVVHGSHGNHG